MGRPPVFRLSGEMTDSSHPTLSASDVKTLVYEILTPQQQSHVETHLDLARERIGNHVADIVCDDVGTPYPERVHHADDVGCLIDLFEAFIGAGRQAPIKNEKPCRSTP